MDELDLGRTFDAVLMFDALHHVEDPAAVVQRVGQHLESGGWGAVRRVFAASSDVAGAWRAQREMGWIETGIGVRALRRWCAEAGMPTTRRFFEPTRPYNDRVRQFGWELIRLVAANSVFAPACHVWLAARRS